jgi:NAD(P)-dependent dehydrogenase (short-subunit alcohol dehydrogenase family)
MRQDAARVAVITGGAGAIGRAIAAELSVAGHTVVSLDLAAADMLAYVTSKGALIALARTLAVGHGADGIAVTCVAPGLTDTTAARRGQPAPGDVRLLRL